MNTPSSEFAEKMWRCVAYIEILLFQAFCPDLPSVFRRVSHHAFFPQSPKHGGRIPHSSLLIQPFGRRVPSHSSCSLTWKYDFLRIKLSMMRPVLGVVLGAKTSYMVSSPLNSLATSRPLIPSFLWSDPPACRNALLSWSSKTIHRLVYTGVCDSVEFLLFGLHRLVSLSSIKQESPATSA